MKISPHNNQPEPRYSVSAVSYAIASLGYPDGPDSSPETDEISELVDEHQFTEWLRELIEISSDRDSPSYQPDSIESAEAAELDGEMEWRATKTLEALTTKQRESLIAQVEAEFPNDICYEVGQLMPLGSDDDEEDENSIDEIIKPQPTLPAKPPYKVTPLDNFDWYEGAGVPTECRDAEHALSVAKGMLERSLAHEHRQAKDPTDAAELFDRWDSFGDYPSIHPEIDPQFDPSEYAKRRSEEICLEAAKPQ